MVFGTVVVVSGTVVLVLSVVDGIFFVLIKDVVNNVLGAVDRTSVEAVGTVFGTFVVSGAEVDVVNGTSVMVGWTAVVPGNNVAVDGDCSSVVLIFMSHSSPSNPKSHVQVNRFGTLEFSIQFP